jgi:hypothetical protein
MRHEALHRAGDLGQVEVPRGTRGHLVVRDRPCRNAQRRYVVDKTKYS